MKNIAIILNYNDFENTSKLVNTMANFKSVSKIIVVDNNSTDDSYMNLQKFKSDRIEILKSKENGGYAKGNNFAMKYAYDKYNNEYFTIANPDIVIEDEVISEIIKEFRNEKTAIISPIMLNSKNEIAENFGWKLPKYKDDLLLTSSILSKIFKPLLYKKNEIEKNNFLQVDVVPGSFFIADAQKMKEVDFFDEETFLYCEERMLAYKLKEKGYKNYISTKYSFVHFHGQSTKKTFKKMFEGYDHLKNSKKIYMKKYLKKGRVSIFLFECLHEFSKIEKYLISKIKNG